MMPQPRRKKWTEAEEGSLIDKYGEMARDGSLSKMKTREKKYKPIALFVNSKHHARDPVTYPWQWTWKDVSTKVQNMRHQYSLVKQKIKRLETSLTGEEEEYDWIEGVTHWSNFIRYKEVFGDVPLAFVAVGGGHECNGGGFGGGDHELDILQFGPIVPVGDGDFVGGIDAVENGVMELEFNYDGDEGERNYNGGNKSIVSANGGAGFVPEESESSSRKKKVMKGLEKKAWSFLLNKLGQLRKLEMQLEQKEMEREKLRQKRENHQIEMEKEREIRESNREKVRREWLQEWKAMERENEERDKCRREEQLKHEREWEERSKRRRLEWKKRMDEMLSQHRAEMAQTQTRILHEQQNITDQLLGIVSQWTGHHNGLSDHAGASSHYLPQMIQNLHHGNGVVVHEHARDEGNNQEDQFIVDG